MAVPCLSKSPIHVQQNRSSFGSWCKVDANDVLHKMFRRKQIKESRLARQKQQKVQNEPLRRRNRHQEITALRENTFGIIQRRCPRLGQRTTSAYRPQCKGLHRHKTMLLHRYRNMTVLKTLEWCGGYTGEIGDDHDIESSYIQKHKDWRLHIYMLANERLVFLEP